MTSAATWLTVRGVELEAIERAWGSTIPRLHSEEGLDPEAPVLDLPAARGRVLVPLIRASAIPPTRPLSTPSTLSL